MNIKDSVVNFLTKKDSCKLSHFIAVSLSLPTKYNFSNLLEGDMVSYRRNTKNKLTVKQEANIMRKGNIYRLLLFLLFYNGNKFISINSY